MSEQNPVYSSALRALEAVTPLGRGGAPLSEEVWLAHWPTLEGEGFTLPAVPAEQGGSEGGWEEELAVIEASAAMAAGMPLAETAVVGSLLAQAGIAVPQGALTFAAPDQCADLKFADGLVVGSVRHLPWGRSAGHVLLPLKENVALISLGGIRTTPATNIAGHARDTIHLEGVRPVALLPGDFLRLIWLRGAAMRSAQIVSAATQALAMTIEYSKTRVQFGRPLSGFQAVQHQMADAASKLEAARITVQAAYDSLFSDEPSEMAVATARINACLAGAACAGTAHQVHGAIGSTREYDLRHHTTAIQAWRAEFGSLRHWNERLGEVIAQHQTKDLWHVVTA